MAMDDATAIRSRPLAGLPARIARAVVGPHIAAHHRRRRLVALVAIAAVALVLGLAVGSNRGNAVGARVGAALSAAVALQRALEAGPAAPTDRTAESAAITRTLGYTPFVRIAGSQHREVALTFDDGPGPYTPAIVGVLRRMHAPATFFEVGIEERYFHASTNAIIALGDPIGDHTELHRPLSTLSPRDQRAEVLDDAAAIGQYEAPFPRLFRPPYGMWDTETLRLLRSYRMLMVLWTVDTNDYRLPGVRAIVDAAVHGARPGAIILLHDAGGDRSETVAALPRIIRALRARRYRLVTVPRLLHANPAPHDQDVVPAAVAGAG
jgi:peptidoglycan/xylan/chitin deacetylase (PgdA/CDA1 family)